MQLTTTTMDARLSELKEIKLKLPVRHHVNLHSLKLLRSESISELVALALEAYFVRAGVPGQSGQGEPAANFEQPLTQ